MSKKNCLFMFILICLFMFVGIDRVEAATGMYCIYDNVPISGRYHMLVQDVDGNINFYYLESDLINDENIQYDSFGWHNAESLYLFSRNSFLTENSKDDAGNLEYCPNYLRFNSTVVIFNDEKTVDLDYELLEGKKLKNSSHKSDNFSISFLTSDVIVDATSYTSQNYKEQWLAEPIYDQSCLYAYQLDSKLTSIQLDIDFTNKKVRIAAVDSLENGINGHSDPLFTIATDYVTDYNFSYIERYFKNSCPIELMGYLFNDNRLYFSYNMKAFKGNDTPLEPYRYDLVKSQPEVGDISITIDKNIVDVEDCEDLLGSELTEILHAAVNVVKILVPILLIVLGIIDFSKAVFGSKEDDMKKASSIFIKRVIIAVVIFFIPSILNILLLIASSIWENIDPTLCGIL